MAAEAVECPLEHLCTCLQAARSAEDLATSSSYPLETPLGPPSNLTWHLRMLASAHLAGLGNFRTLRH